MRTSISQPASATYESTNCTKSMEPQLEDITGIPPRPKDNSTLPDLEAGIVGWKVHVLSSIRAETDQ